MQERVDLGQALRALRKKKGLTAVDVAGQVGVTQTAISRYEVGSRRPSPEVLERILDVLAAPKAARRRLLEQLDSEVTNLRSLRAIAKRGLRRRQEEIARIEADATSFRGFQTAVVPGLLQTPGYAREMFEEVGLGTRTEDVNRAIAVRLDRQAILHDAGRHFGFVISEAVLRWPRGGKAGMLAQLDRVRMVSQLPNVDLAILPLDVRPPLVPLNCFDIFDDDLVLVETISEQLAVHDPEDVELYARAYATFREAALSGPDCLALLDDAAARLT